MKASSRNPFARTTILAVGLSLFFWVHLNSSAEASPRTPRPLTIHSSEANVAHVTRAGLTALMDYAEKHGDAIGGVGTDLQNNLFVDIVDGAAASATRAQVDTVLSQYSETAGQYAVTIQSVQFGLNHLQGIVTELASPVGVGLTLRPVLKNWGVDPVKNQVTIGVPELTPTVSSVLSRAFGDAVSLFVFTEDAHTLSVTRGSDIQPYNGGDRIDNISYGNSCTSGFPVNLAQGGRGMLTAGHCGNRTSTSADHFNNGGHAFGHIGERSLGSGTDKLDSAVLVDQAYSTLIFTGTSASAPVKGRATVSVGDMPCFSGSYTNNVCGRSRVLETDRCASATDQRFGTTVSCHLDGFSNPSASIQPGDSGGPVYDNTTGGILAKGTITSTTSTEGFYEEVLWQLRQWNVTLATS